MKFSPDRFLATHPVFTRSEFGAALAPKRPRTLDSILVQWARRGLVQPVKRGLFLRAGVTVGDAHLHALAARMAPDAALAYQTALEEHGLARILYERLYFATWTKVKRTTWQGREFVPVRPPAGLVGDPLAWTEVVEHGEMELRTTTIERALVDVLDRPELAGGIGEVWDVYSASGVAVDPDAMLGYVERVGKRVLAAKVGFFLESLQDDLAIPDGILDRLECLRPRGTVYWNRTTGSRKARRWNLMVPAEILDAGWEGA